MRRQGIFWIISIVLLLGLFFQYNRMDGFLHLFTVANNRMVRKKTAVLHGKGQQK